MNCFHGPLNKIKGNQGSNIATNEARISSSTARYENTGDAVRAIESLRPDLVSVPVDRQSEIDRAISFLASAIQTNDASKGQVVLAVETISNSSEEMRKRLCEIAVGAVGNLAASSVWESIKFAIT